MTNRKLLLLIGGAGVAAWYLLGRSQGSLFQRLNLKQNPKEEACASSKAGSAYYYWYVDGTGSAVDSAPTLAAAQFLIGSRLAVAKEKKQTFEGGVCKDGKVVWSVRV